MLYRIKKNGKYLRDSRNKMQSYGSVEMACMGILTIATREPESIFRITAISPDLDEVKCLYQYPGIHPSVT